MGKSKSIALLLSVVMFFGLFSTPIKASGATSSPYTVLVYIIGSDLESDGGAATNDLIEMAAVGSTKNINIVVETGGSKKWNLPMISNMVNQRWLVQKENLKLVKNDLGNRSMGKQSTLQDFLVWGVKNYPANKYAVILWDHGAGADGFGYDENNTDDPSLSINEIKGAFKAATAISKKKFELVGFDACLMGNIETATGLKDYGNYMVASEELEPGHGWDYTSLFQAVNKKPSSTGAEFGKAIVNGYKAQATKEGTANQITLSVVNLGKIAAVNDALERFIGVASGDIQDPERIIGVSKARIKSEDYGDAGAHGGSTDMADIYNIAENLKDLYPAEANQLMKSIKASVTYKLNSAAKPNANGLSIYFPCKDKENFRAKLEGYKNTGYSKNYQQFLATYINSILADQTPIKLAQADPNAGSATNSESQSLFQIQVAKEDIEKINEIYSVLAMPVDKEGNTIMFLGMDKDVQMDMNTGIIKDNFTGYWTTLGGQFVSMFVETVGDDYATYTIPAKLNGVKVDIRVLYSSEYPNGVVIGAWKGFDPETGMPDKDIIDIYTGDTIIPQYYFYNSLDGSDGYVDGGSFIVGEELKLESTELPEEKYLYGFFITDTAQNDSYSEFVTLSIKDGMINVEKKK